MNFFFTVNGPFPLIHQIYTQVSRHAGKLQIAAKYLISTTSKHDRPANNHRIACCPFSTPNQKLSQNALSRLSPSEHVNNFWAMEKSGSIIFASQFVRVDVTTMRFQPRERWLARRCVVIFPGTKTHSITWSWVAQGTVIHPSSATPRSEGDVKLHWKLAKVSYLPEGATTTTTKVSSFLLFGGFFFRHTRVRLVDSMHTSGYRERACCWRYCQENKNYNLDWKKLLAAGPCVGWETTSMQKSGKHGSDN